MALTQTQVSQLYVTLFGRASEGAGNTFWQSSEDMTTAADLMLATDASKAYFGTSLDSDQAYIEFIYLNTLNKTYAEDTAGVDFWVAALADGATRGEVAAELINAVYDYSDSTDPITLAAYNQFVNRVQVSDYTAENIEGADLDPSDAAAMAFYSDLNTSVTADPATVIAAEDAVDAAVVLPPGEEYTLTYDTDIATANVFIAPMVWNEAGTDRILSLQDEDVLTGEAGRSDNTLNAVLGQANADEGEQAIRTPTLKNIQILNLDITGTANTYDARFSDSLNEININKITGVGNAATVQNILTKASVLSVANTLDNTSTATFDYVRGVLDGTSDVLDLTLNNVLADSVTVQTDGGALNEGFETVNLSVANGADLRTTLSVEDMEYLNITGTGALDILNQVWTSSEYYAFTAALANGGSIGQRTIDASAFTGDLNIDISLNVGRQVDPGNSGEPYYGVTTGGTGDDTFHTNAGIISLRTDTVHNIIDGGEGNNTLVSYGGGIDDGSTTSANSNIAEITNIQTLELRDQTGMAVVDMDAFDSALTTVFMRDESAGATTFNLDDVSATLAASGLTLAHSISIAGAQTVEVELKDATGSDDTVALTVVNDLNTGNTFDYTLTAEGFDTDNIGGTVNTGVAATSDADAVENITLHDNDTESNVVTLTNIINHTGTVTLDGGTAGKTFTVAGTLNSAVVDGSTQLSDLRLTVGDTVGTITTITQDVSLGFGDDVLTYANIDELDATDSLTDAGGDDTVRAAFSKDSVLDIAGIENLHVTATANVTLDMAKADVTNLVLLANSASLGGGTTGTGDLDNNNVADINIPGGSLQANVITLDNSTLSELNFFGDADNDDNAGAAVDDVTAHTFNGVTLTNNTATDITVNINTSLDANELASTGGGAASYSIGQITTHGNTGMAIVVGNERTLAGAGALTTTTINNIYAKTMTTLSATATGNLVLGTVSGAPLNNSLTTFDMSAVGGDVTANIISLGDNAVVTLANGDNVVSGLGSAGKDVVITAGNGDNTITGTAQDDTITTGSGFDTIAGDRGDNVITSGAGNDTVTAKDGSDTVDLGTGIDTFTDNLGTGIDASLAVNTVSMSGGIATVTIDVDGSGAIVAGTDVDQMLAVGNGSDLTITWTGAAISSATLDGTLAVTTVGGAATTSTSGSNLNVITTGGVSTVSASAGNDVAIFTGSVAGLDGLIFNGGAGNDAAVGTVSVDVFNGGTGADYYTMADVAAGDANSDRIVITDGDSTASGWDIVSGWDVGSAATVVAAVAGTATAGSDVLDLDNTTIATAADDTALTTNITTANGTVVDDVAFTAAGLATFNDDSVAGVGGANVAIGTGSGQVSLANALAALAIELNGTGATATFAYDVTGDGVTADDSMFVFQDGSTDTVIELIGVVATGLENVAGGADTLINIA